MGVNRAEAEQIVEAARRNDVFLQEAFAYRCHPQTDRLLEILSSGTIGEIRLIEAAFGYDAGSDPGNYLFVQDLAGGSLLDVGCYTTSMAHLIAPFVSGGESPITVSAGGHLGPTGVDLTTAATLVFKGGLVARLACSIQLNLDSRVRIYGSEGQVTVPSPWLPGRIGSTAEIVLQHGWSEPEVIDIPLEADVYTVEIDVVSRSVLAGERNPDRMKWQESLTNMNTLDRWRETIGLLYSQDSRPFSAGSDAEGE
jgi:predicted dehydrogenase